MNAITDSDSTNVDLSAVVSAACKMTWQKALDHINGQAYVLDGIDGVIKVDYTRKHDTRISHEATKRGRATQAYQETKRQLGDDWSSDLTNSERVVDIMIELGVDWK